MTSISIVIPTYNRPLLLNRAIRSVLRRAEPDFQFEIVVIDDCSLEQINLEEFKWENIVLKRLIRNSGPQEARNEGIYLATGQWVIMLDDDDEFFEHSLNNVFENIHKIEHFEQYPVFFFATSKGSIEGDFKMIHVQDIMNESLKGDFTPVINRSLFVEHQLKYLDYPEIVGVGCEHLTWLYISSKFQIPTFKHHIVKVNSDAPIRLTSYKNSLKNSLKFALQQDITIDFVKKYKLDKIYPPYLNKKYLGAAIYYLISGKRYISRRRLLVIENYRPLIIKIVSFMTYLPISFSKFFFRIYKMRLTK